MWLKLTRDDVKRAIKAKANGVGITECCPVFQAVNRAFPGRVRMVGNTSVWMSGSGYRRTPYRIGADAARIVRLTDRHWRDIRPRKIFIKGLEREEST